MPEDVQRQLNDNKQEHQTFMEKLDNILEKIIVMNSKIDKMPQELSDKFDDRYAAKSIESWFYTGIGVLVSTFILAVIYLVLSHGILFNK